MVEVKFEVDDDWLVGVVSRSYEGVVVGKQVLAQSLLAVRRVRCVWQWNHFRIVEQLQYFDRVAISRTHREDEPGPDLQNILRFFHKIILSSLQDRLKIAMYYVLRFLLGIS